MARWFDDTAKSAARRDVAGSPPDGMTRRTVITRGAVVAGVAWTAPLLMQTRAYAGASLCPAPGVYCAGSSGTPQCCPVGSLCNISLTGVPTCAATGTPGGFCGNSGNGNGGCTLAKCNGNANQCNGCGGPNICGGESAYCGTNGDVCASGLQCTALGSAAGEHCRKVCTDTTGCFAGQVCDSHGFCAQLCGTVVPSATVSACQGGETCARDGSTNNLTCNYTQSA